jgi:serine/threonine-protein kinase RsbW
MTDLHLSLKSTFDELERLVDEAEAFFGGRYPDEDFVYNLVLLASEAVTNAIEHGNQTDAERGVEVWFRTDGAQAEIVVEDEGVGFDPDSVSDPLDPSRMFEDGGRGVFLMESLADEVFWENGGRRVRMVMRAPQGGKGAPG